MLGTVGAVQGVLWSWASPERSSRELLSSEAATRSQLDFGNPFLQVFLGLLAGRGCWQERGDTAAPSSSGVRMCKEPGEGAALLPGGPTLLQGKPDVLGRGPDPAVRDPSPGKGRGPPPTASSGGCNSLSFSILLNTLKNKFWN